MHSCERRPHRSGEQGERKRGDRQNNAPLLLAAEITNIFRFSSTCERIHNVRAAVLLALMQCMARAIRETHTEARFVFCSMRRPSADFPMRPLRSSRSLLSLLCFRARQHAGVPRACSRRHRLAQIQYTPGKFRSTAHLERAGPPPVFKKLQKFS